MAPLIIVFGLFLFADQSVAHLLREPSSEQDVSGDAHVFMKTMHSATKHLDIDAKDVNDSTENVDADLEDDNDEEDYRSMSGKDADDVNLFVSTNNQAGRSHEAARMTSLYKTSTKLGVTLSVDDSSLGNGDVLAIVKSDSSAGLQDVILLAQGKHTAYHVTADNKCNRSEPWTVEPYTNASGNHHRVLIPAGTHQVSVCLSDGDSSGVQVSLLDDDTTSMNISLPLARVNGVV